MYITITIYIVSSIMCIQQVTVLHNSTYAMLTVLTVQSESRVTPVDVVSQAVRLDLSALEGATLTLGGLNPDTSSL